MLSIRLFSLAGSLMRHLNLIHLGIGNVGKELVKQIQSQRRVDLNYCGLFEAKGGIFQSSGLTSTKIKQFPNHLNNSDAALAIVKVPKPFVLIDTTASDKTIPLIMSALKRGGFAVLSNKKPLASSQKDFDRLHQLANGRLFYETTVGAGLPVIATLKNLLLTGDKVVEIQGCFSGTLGFIMSELDKGQSFSKAVIAAKKLGFTEPDPRDDLSGTDVARKALILSRLIGLKLELSDIKLESLYPFLMNKLTVEQFLEKVSKLDPLFAEKISLAKKQKQTLRFVAKVTAEGCRVGLTKVNSDSDLGALRGPDNIVIFRTKRYNNNPLVVKGPGAGKEVTAAGVFADILTIAQQYEKN